MPKLIVVADPLSGERRTHDVRAGETLGAALVRLWPRGIDGGWRIYRDSVHPDNELAAMELPYHVAMAGETYLIVREMAGPAIPFIANVVMAFLLSKFAEALTPVKHVHVWGPGISDIVSPNNQIAGQSNQLRPGARVPDILGRVRAYPDLLIRPVDTYFEAQQTIQQVFVLGIGAYDVDDAKLGETPLANMQHDAQRPPLRVIPPGISAPAMYVLRASPEVQGISLISDITAETTPSPGSSFIASTKTISTLSRLLTDVERPIVVSDSLFNNGVFWIKTVPLDSQTVGPYLYTVDGPVVNESDTNASFAYPPEIYTGTKICNYGKANPYDIFPPNDTAVEIMQATAQLFEVGDLCSFHLQTGAIYHGRATSAIYPIPINNAFVAKHLDAYGLPQHFPTLSNISTLIRAYRTSGLPTRSAPRDAELLTNAPTPWYASPMPEADELWIDVAFPQGLAQYEHGARSLLTVDVLVEFKRDPATAAQVSKPLKFVYGTATPLRFTRTFNVEALIADGLAPGPGVIEVRLTRVTKFQADEEAHQIIGDTRWQRFAAAKFFDASKYANATVLFLDLSNSRSATALGETSLNVIATRRLPTWSAGVWSAPAGSRRWADNFVARCLAVDGAHRAEAELDIAGIYKLQGELDALEGGTGKLGQISMTLDTMQDIDTELAQIADVVRAVVYRVGRKLFVSRDQANSTAIALFNARTKAPAGESVAVRMTADADNDCVVIQWIDENHGWKRREYQYPEDVLPVNPLRLSLIASNWEQAYRRALFEWNRLKYRREQMSCDVTEDGRMCRPGDVINMTDDVANLATFAGEVLVVAGAILTLDRDVEFIAGTHTLLLRDVQGIEIDRVPVLPGAAPNKVVLQRPPMVEIRGRDTARGTLWAFYPDATANVKPWLITGLSMSGPYVTLTGFNYSPKVYLGDSGAMPTPPTEVPEAMSPITLDDLTVTSRNTGTPGVAQYSLTSEGDVLATAGGMALIDAGDWITTKSNFSLYSARATLVSGAASSGTFGAWLNLATTRTWTLNGVAGGVDGVWLIEIRLNSDGTVEDSATITVHAELDTTPSPVILSDATVSAFHTGSAGIAQYSLTSAGDVRYNNGTNTIVDHGDWLAPKSGMSLYSARATILAGTSTTGTFGAWLNLATTRTWTLSGGGGGVDAAWLIEIRLDSTGVVQDSATLTVHAERDA